MLLTEGINPINDDSDNEEIKEEALLEQIDYQEVNLPSADDNLIEQDDPIQGNFQPESD